MNIWEHLIYASFCWIMWTERSPSITGGDERVSGICVPWKFSESRFFFCRETTAWYCIVFAQFLHRGSFSKNTSVSLFLSIHPSVLTVHWRIYMVRNQMNQALRKKKTRMLTDTYLFFEFRCKIQRYVYFKDASSFYGISLGTRKDLFIKS